MKWSWRIGRVFGVDLYMHATFLLLLAWVAYSFYSQRGLVADAVSGLIFIVLVFTIVVLHELGHVLTARQFGVGTRDITLLPIGGVARLERMPTEPYQELLVALAGPAVNVVLAILCFAALMATSGPSTFVPTGRDSHVLAIESPLLLKLFAVNVSLAVFNMVPAFPMDGGRVLRAFLAMNMSYVRATQIAATIGQFLALSLGFYGLLAQEPFVVFMALFVWMGAAQEASMVQMQSALGGIPVQQVMITSYDTLAPSDPLERAIDRIMAGFQQDFPVVEGDRVVGVLTRANLLKALADQGRGGLVQDVMQREFPSAAPGEMLEGVLGRMQEGDCQSMPVTDRGRLVGLMCRDNVGEFLMIQAALGGKAA
jgi:Zn-dependent protease/CBS domain-containing protein